MDNQINLQYTTVKSPLPEFIYQGLKKYSNNANAYKPQPQELVEKLSKKLNIPKGMIYLTIGIDEAIQLFAHAFGKNTYVFTPTYTVYSDVEVFGGKLNRIDSIVNNTYSISTNKIKDASLIYLANPNNPSGITQPNKVIELIKNNSHSIVCIDEAYGEFGNVSVIDQVKDFSHMTVFRSFSKAYGMAGNRIGYFIAHPNLINKVKNYSQWANVSYLSVGAAMTALDHEDYFRKIREEINTRRDSFTKFLVGRNFKVVPSQINASLIKFTAEEEGTKFVNQLNKNNVVVSHGNGLSNIGMDKSYVRIATGTEEQMNTVKMVIKNYEK